MSERGSTFTASRTSFRDPHHEQQQQQHTTPAPRLDALKVVHFDNLPDSTSRPGLRKELRPWGEIRAILLFRYPNRESQAAYVVFELPIPARCAALAMNQARINGQQVRARLCESASDIPQELLRLYERSFGTVVCARNIPAIIPLDNIGEAFAAHGEVTELEQIEMKHGSGPGAMLMVFVWYRRATDAHAAVLAFDGASPFKEGAKPNGGKDHQAAYPPYDVEVIRELDIDTEKLLFGAPGGSNLARRVKWRPKLPHPTAPTPVAGGGSPLGPRPSPAATPQQQQQQQAQQQQLSYSPTQVLSTQAQAAASAMAPTRFPFSDVQAAATGGAPSGAHPHLMVLSHPENNQNRDMYVATHGTAPAIYLQQGASPTPTIVSHSSVYGGGVPTTSQQQSALASDANVPANMDRSIAHAVAEQLAMPHIQFLVQQRALLIMAEIQDQVQHLTHLYISGKLSGNDLQRSLDDLIAQHVARRFPTHSPP